MKLLEVIVTSADEARAAEQGGADRLELLRDLEVEGLTPALGLVEEVLASVSIPVRTMVRESPNFSIRDDSELRLLRHHAEEFSKLPVDGLVLGFMRNGGIDSRALELVLESGAWRRATFHRAIEAATDAEEAIGQLTRHAQIDRVLINGGAGPWETRIAFLEELQRTAGTRLRILTGGGIDESALALLANSELLQEFHVGSAARDASGQVSSARVAALRKILDSR
jgi:copper homeostasis protein